MVAHSKSSMTRSKPNAYTGYRLTAPSSHGANHIVMRARAWEVWSGRPSTSLEMFTEVLITTARTSLASQSGQRKIVTVDRLNMSSRLNGLVGLSHPILFLLLLVHVHRLKGRLPLSSWLDASSRSLLTLINIMENVNIADAKTSS